MSDGKVVFDITGNLSGINSALNDATSTISKQTAKWTVLGQTAMNGLVSAAKAGFDGIKALAKNAFEYNASMETYEVNFRTLLGSAEAAQAKLAELKDYAAKTPFAMDDLADATQTLLAFGLNSEEASLALKHLGDISLGDANKLNSLTLAFAQVSSAGKLAGQDLLQMINAGFNPLNVIAEKTGAAYADLKAVMSGEKTSEDFQLRMEAARREVEELGTSASEGAIMLAQIGKDGMISADMVAAAMRIATSEGGAFYKALENASQTAKGQIATIQDSWNMLTGKMTGGVFDALSQEALPKVIGWLDELNAAFDENGFMGLKTAAERIFGEIGSMALNLGSELIAKLYNGITGDTKTASEISTYLSGLWTDASASLSAFTDSAGGLLGTIWTSITGQEPTAANITKTVGGLFSAGVDRANDLLGTAATFMADLDKALGDDTLGTGDRIAAVFRAGSNAMGKLLTDGADFFVDLYSAITGKETNSDTAAALDTFFNKTFPETWAGYMDNVKRAWEENVTQPIDSAAQKVVDFFGIEVPEDWSLTAEIGKAWDSVTAKIQSAIDKVNEFIGIVAPEVVEDWQDVSDHYAAPEPFYGFEGWSDHDIAAAVDYIKAYAQVRKGNKEYTDMMGNAMKAIHEGQEKDAASFATAVDELFAAIENGDPVQIPAEWLDGTDAELQEALSGMNLSVPVAVNPVLTRTSTFNSLSNILDGWFGQDHASGGIFTSATRFLGQDSLHTIGESGAEAVLPLDTLWRKMGLIFDQTFAANLDSLQYSIMPPLPAATPAHMDGDDLGEKIAECVREAISGLTVEMDRRVVGRILAPEISQNIAHDVNGRRWTS